MFTGDLVLYLLIGRHLILFFPQKLLMGFHSENNILCWIQIVCKLFKKFPGEMCPEFVYYVTK